MQLSNWVNLGQGLLRTGPLPVLFLLFWGHRGHDVGSRISRRFGRRATYVKNGNAGPSNALEPMGGKGVSGPPVCDGLLSTQ